ncbi:hypothetical protein [Paraburkholderia ultramafica]|uniref:hypothetical protein n=1 Tax=Paraburkholderia ultramafica TaxID=1544867 RepID=UPI00158184BE|nr:hypothetical protein [Paraburkholderia ultramafica]
MPTASMRNSTGIAILIPVFVRVNTATPSFTNDLSHRPIVDRSCPDTRASSIAFASHGATFGALARIERPFRIPAGVDTVHFAPLHLAPFERVRSYFPKVPAPLHLYLEECHIRAQELNAIEAITGMRPARSRRI